MQFIFNELSLHGQFTNPVEFRTPFDNLLAIISAISQTGFKITCTKSLGEAMITSNLSFKRVLYQPPFTKNDLRVVLSWIEKNGPFLEENRRIDANRFLCSYQNDNDDVTNNGIGDAAYRLHFENEVISVISIAPSVFEISPIIVDLYLDQNLENAVQIEIPNYLSPNQLKEILDNAQPKPSSWPEMLAYLRIKFPNVSFANDTFDELSTYPFNISTFNGIVERIRTLNELRSEINFDNSRTQNGDIIYNTHFIGERAHFSDSSTSEKRDFQKELTFNGVFCPWHGKINSSNGPIRIHFEWPLSFDSSVKVVYVGPKLTKR